MNKLKKNLSRENWKESAETKNEQRQQLLEDVIIDLRVGRFSALIKSDKIDDYLPELKKQYPDVKNVTAKIFFTPTENDSWGSGDYTIHDSSTVQNIYAFNGLAPRIYEITRTFDDNREYITQITEDLGEYEKEVDIKKIQSWYKNNILKIAHENNISIGTNDIDQSNIVKDKWVDFQSFHFTDKQKAKDNIKKFSEDNQTWQENTYQSIPALGVKGVRDETRLIDFQPDFENKRVIDLGCSGGSVCNIASSYGASWVVGIDLPEVVEAARQSSNHLGYFNIEYYAHNLVDETLDLSHLGKFDIIFHLSMYQHIKLPSYVEQLMHKDSILYFEGNPYKPVAFLRPELEKVFNERFSRVEYLGHSSDYGARPLYKIQL